ncbi:MAG TPA: efflux RND transporter periplasmic adaptor subunit [Holophaga sp.]|nr:efflux RND transporter periplasmic adaptor subunit [Holophaga sp.]
MNPRHRIFVLLGLLVLGSLGYYFATTDRSTDLVLLGTVDADEVVVGPVITGRIVKLAVQEGQDVKGGDLVAVLDSLELTSARDAQAASARSTKGDTASAVANAKAALSAAQASLAEAEADRAKQEALTRRTVSLAERGVVSSQDKDSAEQALKAAAAHETAARDQVAASRASLEAARARTLQAEAASAQTAEAEARVGYTKVLAPTGGKVTVRAAREGEVVSAGGTIVTITDLSQTWVYAAIPETEADAVKLGDVLAVRMPSGAKVDGKVIVKSVEGDFATQRDVSRMKRDIKTVRIKLLIPNPGEAYVPGMTAEVLVPKSRLVRA